MIHNTKNGFDDLNHKIAEILVSFHFPMFMCPYMDNDGARNQMQNH